MDRPLYLYSHQFLSHKSTFITNVNFAHHYAIYLKVLKFVHYDRLSIQQTHISNDLLRCLKPKELEKVSSLQI
jgi:hypothetical protein